jgi:menaquinone reductase, multiheme cytochrome c subunit
MTRGAIPLAILVGALATCGRRIQVPPQPLPFSHALHAGRESIGCTTCHAGAETEAASGLPAFSTCLGCHMKPQGEPRPSEAAVRDLAATAGPAPWVQVTRNPGHVYFSHRAHVGLARMTCASCHGDVTRWERPPDQPEERLRSMAACQACHRREGAPLGCATCHR